MVKHILYDCKRKLNSENCSSDRNGLMKTVYVSVKIIVHGKKIIVGILAHAFARMANI